MLLRSFRLLLIILLAAIPALAGDDAPSWLRQAADLKVPEYDGKVTSVVLVDESTMTVGEDGHVVESSIYAIKVLTREGRADALALTGYSTDFEKVRDFHAWLIRPSGQIKSYGKDQVVDESDLNDVYDESRLKKINARDDVEPGAVFGYQVTTERRPFFSQSMWYFQSENPVVSSKLKVVLPTGWRATSITFNHEKIEPTEAGTTYTWELRDLPPLKFEPASPSLINMVPRLAVNYFPTEGFRVPASRGFDSWVEVSRWYTTLSDPQVTSDERISAKARDLTVNAKSELDKIIAVARYVQNIQYISIQIGLGRWRPHAASDVLAKSYGDCKDKANLMRAMLRALNIQSYPVLIHSGDPSFVQEIWPSPRQFNHCIIAIKISDETQLPAVLTHPKLGRLLIFDATDDITPVGDLPDYEQDSLALIAAGDGGSLLKMPATSPETNRLDREAEVQLSADGSITASLREKSIGQAAANERRGFHGLSITQYKKMIEHWVTRGATGAQVTKIEPAESENGTRFSLAVDFSAANYGQVMQNRLLVFKPAIVSRRESLSLTEVKRVHPIVLQSQAFTETVRVKLPAGFEVDELPDTVKLDAPFGTYKATYTAQGNELIFTRGLAQRAATIPASEYEVVRKFYERIRAAEQAPVVLVKKQSGK